jgi:hypothetical protein
MNVTNLDQYSIAGMEDNILNLEKFGDALLHANIRNLSLSLFGAPSSVASHISMSGPSRKLLRVPSNEPKMPQCHGPFSTALVLHALGMQNLAHSTPLKPCSIDDTRGDGLPPIPEDLLLNWHLLWAFAQCENTMATC